MRDVDPARRRDRLGGYCVGSKGGSPAARHRAQANRPRPEPHRGNDRQCRWRADVGGGRKRATGHAALRGCDRSEPGAAPSAARGRRALDRGVPPRRPAGRRARGPATFPASHGRGVGGVDRPRDERHNPPRRGAVAPPRLHEGRVRGDAPPGGGAHGGTLQTGGSHRSRMVTVDRVVIRAPIDRAFQLAADVEHWPHILSHYRWVRFLDRRNGGGTVEMAASRPFGLFRYPTWWVSEMTVDRRAREIRYRHVRGITQGMDVVWQIVPGRAGAEVTIMHDWAGPAWPLVGALAADLVIGPIFIHGIAARTLAGIKRALEHDERGFSRGPTGSEM